MILAEHEGKVVLVEQPRVPIGRRCLELPAGLIGDDDGCRQVEARGATELEEETGFAAERIELLGEYFSSPGMVAESFTLVRAHGLRRIGAGGGIDGEDIVTHLVAARRHRRLSSPKSAREGVGIDVKLLLLLGASLAP